MVVHISTPLAEFLISALLSWAVVWILLPILRQRLLDTPNQRSSHQSPKPRGGGVAFVLVGSALHSIFSTGTGRWIPLLCLPLAFVGLLDDRKHVPAVWRYLAQILTASILLTLAKVTIPLWAFPWCLLLITAIINFMNFIDGLDGLLAGSAVVLMAATSAWSISGSIFGFLIWNWSPAKVFMGDVGSTYIGAVFAGLLLQEQSTEVAFSMLLFGFPLLADPGFCVLRRLYHRQNIFSAHRQHLYQRLNQAAWSHRLVATMYILAVLTLVIIYAIGGLRWLLAGLFAEFVLAIILEKSVATSFNDS
jgi:UDP-N-acetylmuramyl pentapeptide phosphotransferase/UDP-N-acetylglucosamine-1-phosphate transferase